MATIRSALVMLGRRSCGSSGFPATASFGGRGLEIHQGFRPAAPGTPSLPSLRPAGRSLESWRRFSTAGGEPAKKAEGGLRMWCQRARYRVKHANVEERSKFLLWYSTIGLGSTTCYMMKTVWDIHRLR